MDETIENIGRLELAIQQISNVKHNLGKNATEVKSQIRTNISRLLEALRNREVWLLNQVDLIVSTKEEVLHHQQAGLNKQLGVLQSSQGAERFELGDLKPEETPFIDFRADSATLREHIVNYGRVDVSGLPPKSVFVSPGNPSSSLPRHFEEYDDLDHHVLYKTVEEVSRTKSSDTCVYVSFPKLSTKAEDWLTKTKTSMTTTTVPKFSFSPFSDNTSDWLLRPSGTDKSQIVTSTTCFTESVVSAKAIPSVSSAPSLRETQTDASIQSWLQQIKQNPDVEDDDDFELVENSESLVSLEDLMITHQSEGSIPSSKSAPQLKAWSTSVTEDLAVWLKTGTVAQTDTIANVFPQLKTTSKVADQKKWLAPQSVQKVEKISCFGDKCKMTTFPMEIENLGDFSCLVDKNKWLSKSKKKAPVPEISWLCKANEPCQKDEDCVCEPTCMDKYLQSNTSSCCNFSSIFDGTQFQHKPSESGNWILGGSKNVQPTTPVKSMLNFKISKDDTLAWLKTDQPVCNKNSPNITHSTFKQVHTDSDISDWLKKDDKVLNVELANGLPDFGKFSSVRDGAEIQKWLSSTTSESSNNDDITVLSDDKDNNKETEKWLFRSANKPQSERGDGGIWFRADNMHIEELA